MSYLVPAQDLAVEETLKKSRFITLLAHTQGLAAARAFWQDCKDKHPGARHWCFAAVAGHPTDGQQYAMSDDGEPAGTAGKPMLAQLLGSGLGEVSAVVVRYYGGVKLGTGGLVRAYGGGVASALKALPSRLCVHYRTLELTLPYGQLPDLQYWLQKTGSQVLEESFADKVQLRIAVPDGEQEGLLAWLALQPAIQCRALNEDTP
ncbi:YigZ family protein [Gallaecimonas xiamenensis]|uniref:Impact N-terminal domain-containing protein n=1 Tax=Gallaecimonas xiamenensis 3-C-1 TaxID=745411 RepID=K2IZR9_9GAMM|nr:YigZ family protein [Gallaecimonas xiamenensis]EKE68047.1 hypothetical protein B3C1_17607 [Gallaecimonas xiamenensis 3-C-1]